ncbi:GGDEF domain-containing protein [Thiomicrospira microaerophila]|uniref:GGDEF domain-containing protein n=1 Tax=Thiomicrospira microaerophila TaxID=406020 RepID=UPI00200E3626|nr:GGDEF domain-containing protein [Thiomicrospira microaerophila]UQB41922.1 GGDEF domain-containing protein [Thiomicrospira microaerophila]
MNLFIKNANRWVIVPGLVIPLFLALIANFFLADLVWPNPILHALLEGAGVIVYMSLGIYITTLVKTHALPIRFYWPVASFLSMGVITVFHGSSEPGNTFVGLHSVSVLIGGLLMAMIALPSRLHKPSLLKHLPWLGLVIGFGISLAMIMMDQQFPTMLVEEGVFSETAIILNTLGAVGFLVATLHLLFYKKAELSHWALAVLTLLFSASAILFEYSALWDATWWLWHFLRFMALSMLLAYFFHWFYKQAEDAKSQADKLENLAFRDSLTQLPNRALFYQQFNLELQKAKRNQFTLALLFIDLDRFKQVNDTLGHDIGDKLLVLVAARLNHALRQADLLARMGGDEFTVILNGHQTEASASKVAQHIINTLTPNYQIDQHDINIGASIGIAFYPKDGSEMGTLMRLADTAMYQAKAAGRNTYRIYQSD